jgi:hypothetical protein
LCHSIDLTKTTACRVAAKEDPDNLTVSTDKMSAAEHHGANAAVVHPLFWILEFE